MSISSSASPVIAPPAVAPESVTHFIAGKRTASRDARQLAIFNPANGEIAKTVSVASPKEISLAAQAAAEAFPGWAATSPLRRARVFFRFRDLIEKHRDQLARLISAEHGKTVDDARGEVTRGLEVVEFVCGVPQLLKGDFTPQVGTGIDSYGFRQPLGVVLGITPFNFPAMVPMWMFPVALACGNTFILKPSERDPSASILLAELLKEAGLPDGVFNVVHGDGETVKQLIALREVQAVSFVGSTAVAEAVSRQGNAAGKRVQALGGAKNHMVIMPDADLDMAADGLIGAAFGSAGERCMAISVAVPVGEQIANQLLSKLIPKVKALQIGDGADDTTEMGPLVTEAHRKRVLAYLDIGLQEGAELVVDGRKTKVPQPGFYLGASIFDRVTPQMRIYREEIFGPVLVVVRARNMAEALTLANEHEYGNGVAIFTRDGATAQAFAAGVSAGMVGVNVPIPVPMAFHSFGGWKRSIFADHYMHGLEGVRFYTRLKTVTARWPSAAAAGPEFIMPTH
jgi:malonate-semialdehyde dehydrogenase (acetylating) / methylmalonate-semialdehyde dehydrogenase